MSKKENWEKRTEELLVPIAEANHVEIYDVEYVKEGSDWYLRCYIDKEGGVSIDDCETVSRALSDELDREDFISDAYILEVSSPGLGRQLKRDRHFEKSLGQEVVVKTYQPVEGRKEFTGILKAYDGVCITLEAGQQEQGRDMVFEKKDVAVVKLTFDF